MDIKSVKKELRKRLKEELKQIMSDELRLSWSSEIVRQIELLPSFKESQKIALFCSLWDEPDLSDLLSRYHIEKELYIPRVEGENIITFYRYQPSCTQMGGMFDIEEPVNLDERLEEPSSLDLILVPGMGFDRQGHRMGRGKGYYDRFLDQAPNTHRIAVSFDCRILEEIPTEEWDLLMDGIVSEKGYTSCEKH